MRLHMIDQKKQLYREINRYKIILILLRVCGFLIISIVITATLLGVSYENL